MEVPVRHAGAWTFFVVPYAKIKYREKRTGAFSREYILYINEKRVKTFKRKKRVIQFIKQFITNQFLAVHDNGLEKLKQEREKKEDDA